MASNLPDAKELEGRKEQPEPPPQSRDFFWDVVILYVVASILALAAIDAVSEFIRGSDIQCYWPNETDSERLSSVGSYVNEFCTRYIPTLQLLPTIVVIHAILILIPHYTWFNAYGAELDFFFIHVWKLKRYRDQESGYYPNENYAIARQLKEAFHRGRSGMYWWYIAKILLQIILCLVGLFLVPTLLFELDEQNVTFQCPQSESEAKGDSWPLPDRETVICIFSPLNLLQKLWVVYIFLLALAVFFMTVNLLQLIKWHRNELGAESFAQFSFETGLPYHCYRPKIWNLLGKNSCLSLYPFSPFSIRTDYDFLMVRLFRTDCGLAYVMKEVTIGAALLDLDSRERLRLHVYRQNWNAKSGDLTVAGWRLVDDRSRARHRPALMDSVLVMPSDIRGIVMGLALRCEGDYDDYHVGYLQRVEQCHSRAKKQYILAKELLLVSQYNTEQPIKDLVNKLKKEARELMDKVIGYVTRAKDLNKFTSGVKAKEMDLKSKEEELATKMSKMEEMMKLESQMKESLEQVRARGYIARAQVLAKNLDVKNLKRSIEELSLAVSVMELMIPEGDDKLVSAKDSLKTAKAKVESGVAISNEELERCQVELKRAITLLNKILESDFEQHGGLRLFTHLGDTASAVSKLQEEIMKLEEELKELKATVRTNERKVSTLKSDIRTLIRKQKKLARDQREAAKQLSSVKLQQDALSCLGPRLMCALVIGFDLDSGLPSALARIFKRVGFINFSSHYGNYKDPVHIVSRSLYIYSITVPADILTCDSTADNDTEDQNKKSPAEKILTAMSEIWWPDHRYNGRDGDFMKTNYIVVGPVKDDVQIATVNRVLDSCHRQNMVLPNTLLVTIKIDGIMDEYEEYKPPSDHYGAESLPCNVSLGDPVRDWDGASEHVADDRRVTMPPFPIDVEDSSVHLDVKLYRKIIPVKSTQRTSSPSPSLTPPPSPPHT